MKFRSLLALALAILTSAAAQAQAERTANSVLLRLDPGGPTSLVTAVAFSPDGKTLYTAGWDKLVRAWTYDKTKSPPWVVEKIHRVPIGPGKAGAINALAVSPDGNWIAVGGLSIFRGATEFRGVGMVVPSPVKTQDMLEDEGMIYIINVKTEAVKGLRGHLEAVTNLAFVADSAEPLLVSTAHQFGKSVGQVRLWDVTAGTSTELNVSASNKTDRPWKPSERPGLTARRTGKGLKDVVVAIAWYDQLIRFWDVARSELIEQQDGRANATAAYHTGKQAFVTASFRPGVGCRLSAWPLENGRPKLDVPVGALAPDAGGIRPFSTPQQSLTLLPIPGKTTDGAALIVRRQGVNASADDTEELALLDLKTGKEVGQRLSLGKVTGQLRLLAASREGDFLALADGDNNRVVVHAVADLLTGRSKGDELPSAGSTFRRVAFVKKGDDQGLVLNETRPPVGEAPSAPRGNDLIFDFTGRKLTADQTDWKLDAPDVSGWQLRHGYPQPGVKGDPRPYLAVRKGAEKEMVIWFDVGSEITAYALAPSGDKFAIPLIAAASLDRNRQPLFRLFRADTGERVRQFIGHTSAVRSIAFSKDGRLLVSTAEDQTVAVWSQLKLEEALGKSGRILGLAVQLNAAKLEVIEVGPGSPLKKGDLIDGIVQADKTVLAFKTSNLFYEAVYKVEPGKDVTVRVGGRDVPLRVVQGVDEHNPLFTLFVSKAAKLEDRLWIGWHPAGSYEVSADAAEEFIGWHFNTEKKDSPTIYAKIGEYKDKHEKKGILKKLARLGNHTLAVAEFNKEKEEAEAKKTPKPRLQLLEILQGGPPRSIGRDSPNKFKGLPLVRQRDLKLRVIDNSDFPEARIAARRWELIRHDKEKDVTVVEGEFVLDKGEWIVDPSKFREVKWVRGAYDLRVVISTQEAQPRAFPTEPLSIYYVPEAPVIVYAPELKGMRLRMPTLQLRADVKPGADDQKIVVRYGRQDLGLKAALNPARIDEKIDLKPETNILEIVAVNADAPIETAGLETTRETFSVDVVNTMAPTVVLLSVTEAATGQQQEIKPGQPVTVGTRQVRIHGEIEGAADVTAAYIEENQKTRPLQKINPGKKVAFVETMTLEPGKQSVVSFSARTAESPVSRQVVLALTCMPPLPRVEVLEPTINAKITPADKPVLRALLILPPDWEKYDSVVAVDGKPQAKPSIAAPVLDNKSGKWIAELTTPLSFEPGKKSNLITVELSNPWGAKPSFEQRHVRYVRPPLIENIVALDAGPKPRLDYTAIVRSELKPTGVLIDGVEKPKPDFLVEPNVPNGTNLWRVVARDVKLNEGANTFLMQVRNDEDTSTGKITPDRRYAPPMTGPDKPPDKPVVIIQSPNEEGGVVETPNFKVQFEVTSKVPFRSVKLLRNGVVVYEPKGVTAVARTPAGIYEIKAEPLIPLDSGNNVFSVEAENDGGRNEPRSAMINFIYRPVRLVIDSFVERAPGNKVYRPKPDPQSRLIFDQVDSGRVQLRGHVEWVAARDQELRKDIHLRVYVNGFQQIPVILHAAEKGKNERYFEVDVLLSRAENNLIHLDLPDLARGETDNSRLCKVQKCKDPAKGLRMHLLVVGVGQPNGQELVEQAKKALGVGPDPKDPEKKSALPAFEEVIVYEPLARYVRQDDVFRKLDEVKLRIDQGDPRDRDARNDLVMLYYQGKEKMTSEGHFFLTDDSKYLPLKDSAVNLKEVTRFLADTRGAQLMLLDVERVEAARVEPDQDGIAQWPRDPFIGVFRFAWWQPADAPRLLTTLEQQWEKAINFDSLVKNVTTTYQKQKAVSFDAFLGPGLGQLPGGWKPNK